MSTALDIISTFVRGIDVVEKGGKVVRGLIRGPCTSERRDLQDEKIFQDGADFSPFTGADLSKSDEPVGSVTYEHPAGVFNIVGEPEELEKGFTSDGVKAHVLTTRLHVDVGNELADGIWTKVEQLRKARSRVRLGYSVEGRAKLRASYDKQDPRYKDILESAFHNVVITGRPRNRDALFDAVAASLQAVPGGLDILRAASERVGRLPADLGPEEDAIAKAAADEFVAVAKNLKVDARDVAIAAVVRAHDRQAWNRALARLMRSVAANAA